MAQLSKAGEFHEHYPTKLSRQFMQMVTKQPFDFSISASIAVLKPGVKSNYGDLRS